MKNKKVVMAVAIVVIVVAIIGIIFISIYPRKKAHIDNELDKYRSDIETVILQYEINNNVTLNYEIKTSKNSHVYTIECIAKDDYTKNICDGDDEVMIWIKVDKETFKRKMAGGYSCFEDAIYDITED